MLVSLQPNRVRQGKALSQNLFAVYLDELSVQLVTARMGWTVGNMLVYHLLFADDLSSCVFGPNLSGFDASGTVVVIMQQLKKKLL